MYLKMLEEEMRTSDQFTKENFGLQIGDGYPDLVREIVKSDNLTGRLLIGLITSSLSGRELALSMKKGMADMGGLYNMLFGVNPASHVILATLGLNVHDVGRFRDCYVANGEIAVYTREEYQEIIDKLAEHPCYLRDADDEFDCTYCTIYFRYPEEWAEDLKKIESSIPFDPDARWKAMLDAMKVKPEDGLFNGERT
jgi:hypothetical protein